jgi:hypothetical protein
MAEGTGKAEGAWWGGPIKKSLITFTAPLVHVVQRGFLLRFALPPRNPHSQMANYSQKS